MARGADPAGAGETAQEFWSDDEGFLAWLWSHQDGYVVNCERRPKASYLKLHRVSCRSAPPRERDLLDEPLHEGLREASANTLDAWANSRTSAVPDRCPTCKPSG